MTTKTPEITLSPAYFKIFDISSSKRPQFAGNAIRVRFPGILPDVENIFLTASHIPFVNHDPMLHRRLMLTNNCGDGIVVSGHDTSRFNLLRADIAYLSSPEYDNLPVLPVNKNRLKEGQSLTLCGYLKGSPYLRNLIFLEPYSNNADFIRYGCVGDGGLFKSQSGSAVLNEYGEVVAIDSRFDPSVSQFPQEFVRTQGYNLGLACHLIGL